MRKATWTLLLLLPLCACAQWPLNQISFSGYQWSGNTQNLLSKVRYSRKGSRLAVYNLVYATSSMNPSIHGVRWNEYPFMDMLSMMIMRDTTYQMGGYDQNIFISGSSSNYARDIESDDQDRLFVLGDNLGDDWAEGWTQPTPWTVTSQVLLLKLDQQQHVLWHRTYGGTANEHAVAIRRAHDGNFIILAAAESSNGDVAQSFGGTDVWLFKVDAANGNILWQKSFGGPGNDIPSELEVLADGSIIISGSAPSSAPDFVSSFAGANGFVLRLNAAGVVQNSYVAGGSGTDAVRAIAPMGTSGFALLLESTSGDGPFTGNAGANDIYVMRLTAALQPVWTKRYGNAQDDEAGDIVFTPCDSILFVSYAKQYSYDFPGPTDFPAWTQRAGVRIALRGDGTQTFYQEENFNYPFSNGPFNEGIFSSMEPNDRGGFLSGNLKHDNWNSGYPADKARSFDLREYGTRLRRGTVDTAICSGQPVNGITYTRDSVLADTLRNACGIDTLIRAVAIHIIATNDSLIHRDTTLCAGALYNGTPVLASFLHSDSTLQATACGPRWVIKQTMVQVINTTADSTLRMDTTLCYGALYNGTPQYTSFAYIDSTQQATTCGIRWIIRQHNISVRPAISVDLGPDATLCAGTRPTLDAGNSGSQYLWSTGSMAATVSVTSAGLYWVEVRDAAGCRARDSVLFTASDLFLNTLRDTSIEAGYSVLLSPASNGSISWDPSPALSCAACPAALAVPPATAWFYYTATRAGCRLRDSVQVIVKDGFYIWVPTAFTPNGDGRNDRLRVHASRVTALLFVIYNRWGEPVFSTTNASLGWDGTFRGQQQDGGTFAWMLRYTDPAGMAHLLKGTLQLIR
ncbi:T9SS type B sorting domain-containing protein [Flaviaesturariibacter terrae]